MMAARSSELSSVNLLGYIEMKTMRAKGHLDAFNGIADAFLIEAYAVTTREDVENGRCIRRTDFAGMPPELGMELGEFLYCLRSGLDQMAFQLVLPEARKKRPSDICFPIVSELVNSQQRRNLKKALELFPSAVADTIDALQPYKGLKPVENHPLWQLNKLCNIDKHWIVPFHSRSKHVYVPILNPPAVVTCLSSDTEDAIEVSIPLAEKHQFDFDPNRPGDLDLGEWNSDLIIPRYRLADIYGFITCTVIPAFRRFDGPIIESTPARAENPQPVYEQSV